MSETCHTCKRVIPEGATAWASDWTVLHVTGIEARWRTETRYTCDDCD